MQLNSVSKLAKALNSIFDLELSIPFEEWEEKQLQEYYNNVCSLFIFYKYWQKTGKIIRRVNSSLKLN